MKHPKYHPLRANRNIKNLSAKIITLRVNKCCCRVKIAYFKNILRRIFFNVSVCPKGMIFGVIHLICIYYMALKNIPKKADPSGHVRVIKIQFGPKMSFLGTKG